MQICEYFFENACYSVTKYYLCKQNNKRSLLGRKQQSQVARSFPNRYLFSYTNKVTSLFSISCILDIILRCEIARSCNILLYNELCNAYTFENIYIFINFFLFLNMLVTIPLKALFLDYQTLYSTAFYKIFQKSKQA